MRGAPETPVQNRPVRNPAPQHAPVQDPRVQHPALQNHRPSAGIAGPGPADAVTVPDGRALRGPVLAALDRGGAHRRPRTGSGLLPHRLRGVARLLPRRLRGVARLVPRRPWDRRTVVRAALGVAATAVLGPVVAFAFGFVFFAVPTPDDAAQNQVSVISYADGAQLTRIVPEQGNRIVVPLERVPPAVREAVLAAEDRSFYSNPGFDLTGIMRAAFNQLRGGVGGGSTITQQYVKNTRVGAEATLWRKYREMVVAVKISQERTKDEILGDYLNAIYFGRGAYGIQSAAQAYFGRPVETLTPAEGALLAGVIQSPSRWDPALNPDKAVQRWNFVLDGMVAQGWLSPADRAAATFPVTVPRRPSSGGVPADARGHIVTA
ncbi:MAG: hypothetical protein QOK35_2467, partial [Pseudonocardiales bacterium]|nr:hypothetical protein [Pseudonocardiales bacterium]